MAKADNLPDHIEKAIERCEDPIKPLSSVDVLIIVTPWDDYKAFSHEFLLKKNTKLKIVDQNGLLRKNNKIINNHYFSVGFKKINDYS